MRLNAAMVQRAEQRASFRLTNVSSKLSQNETAQFDALAKRRGQQTVERRAASSDKQTNAPALYERRDRLGSVVASGAPQVGEEF